MFVVMNVRNLSESVWCSGLTSILQSLSNSTWHVVNNNNNGMISFTRFVFISVSNNKDIESVIYFCDNVIICVRNHTVFKPCVNHVSINVN